MQRITDEMKRKGPDRGFRTERGGRGGRTRWADEGGEADRRTSGGADEGGHARLTSGRGRTMGGHADGGGPVRGRVDGRMGGGGRADGFADWLTSGRADRGRWWRTDSRRVKLLN